MPRERRRDKGEHKDVVALLAKSKKQLKRDENTKE